MKLFLTGPIGVGKSTVIQRCLSSYTGALWGFRSFKTSAEGPADVLLTEAAQPENRHVVAHVGPAGGTLYPHVFDEAGAPMLRKITAGAPGLVLMDEIGYIEAKALAFQQEILRVLALDVPVLGVLRQPDEKAPPFLLNLHACASLTIVTVSEGNRDGLPATCRRLLQL